MRLVKLLSVLFCIVVLIGLMSFSVSAERVLDNNGYYTFTDSDLLEVFRYNTFGVSVADASFPVKYLSGGWGAQQGFFLDFYFYIDSDNGQIIVPNGYTLELVIDGRWLFGPDGETDDSNWSGAETELLSSYIYGDSSSGLPPLEIANNSAKSMSNWRYQKTTTWKNTTGSDYHFNNIRVGNIDGIDSTNSYSLSVTSIKFRILSDQEVQTDKILNGWTSDPQKPTGSGKVDQQTQLEEQIKNDTAQGRQETNDILNSAPSIIGNYTNGFLFLMGLFGLATDIPLLDSLLNISLAMGLFIFFLNLVPSIVTSVQRSSNKKRGG